MKTDTTKRKKSIARKAIKKNELYSLYRRCDKDKSLEFRNHLIDCKIPYNTFINDCKAEISKIDAYRYLAYCEFFGYENVPNYLQMKQSLNTNTNEKNS